MGPIFKLPDYLFMCEALYLASVLERCGGNVTQAAKLAGVGRQSLYARLRAHSIPLDRNRPTARRARGEK